MPAVFHIAAKDLRLLTRDRFGLFWILVWPLVFALFFGSIFSGSGSTGSVRVNAIGVGRAHKASPANGAGRWL